VHVLVPSDTDTATPQKRRLPRRGRRRWWLVPACGALILLALWGVRRFVYLNFGAVVDGAVYRSAQPTDGALKAWSQRHGLRTIVNLRGAGFEGYEAYRSNAERLDLEVHDLGFSAKRPPPAPLLRDLIRILESAPRPMLLHCHSGVDRSGMASVLAAMALGGQTYEQARSQRPLWSRHADSVDGYIETVFEDYEAWCRSNERPFAGWAAFKAWAMKHYHPLYYRVALRHPASVRVRAGGSVAFPITIINRSKMILPLARPGLQFNLTAFSGDSVRGYPEREYGRTEVPRTDVAPGDSVTVQYTLHAPTEAGSLNLSVDLIDENRSFFGRQGSPITALRVEVDPARRLRAPNRP